MIGAAIEVHRVIGPGLLESAYEECLCRELEIRNGEYERQVPLDLTYKGVRIRGAYRIDLVVDRQLVVEIKSVPSLLPLHASQLLTYMRLTTCRLGLLLNFNVPVLRMGIRRYVL